MKMFFKNNNEKMEILEALMPRKKINLGSKSTEFILKLLLPECIIIFMKLIFHF